MAESKIVDLLAKCENELEKSFENGDNKRIVVKSLQEIASQKYDLAPYAYRLEKIFHILWDHSVLLEDCILVSGIIFTKMNQGISYLEICEKAKSLKNEEWVYMSIMRGILLDHAVPKSQDQLNQLAEITISAINLGFTSNRSVLISRQLENLLSIFTLEQNLNVYDFQGRGNQIISIVTRALRLNADLTDYKSRDLIKWHLNILISLDNSIHYTNFSVTLMDCLPEANKITVQICDSLCAFDFKNNLIPMRILKLVSPCLHVKGGLGSSAASCIGKLLTSQGDSDSCNLLPTLIDQILEYPSSRDIIKIFNMILGAVNKSVKESILKILKGKKFSLINQLLIVNIQDNFVSSDFETLLTSNDEFVALEAFSLLTRDSVKKRRKPTDSFSQNDLNLFQSFINDVIFSGSVDFRQKVSVSAKSLYEQIFARIYHLIRESSKQSRENQKSVDSSEKDIVPIIIDRERLTLELNELFDWLGKFVKVSLVEPFDFCHSNFGSVEFAFTQILSIINAFEGNATLVAANSAILSQIATQFQSSVVEFALNPAMNNFIKCVGKSTYDSLRLRAMDIICKCNVDASSVPVKEYYSALNHPRAINNEGAARIILLHARLSKTSQISSVISDLTNSFKVLKSNFPNSLRDNNINGRLLSLKFLIQDQTNIKSELISEIISLSKEISNFVSEIASHPSPEGLNIPSLDDEDEDADNFEDDIDDGDLNSKESIVSSQYVLSFSWRAVKETSTLLETLLKIHPSCVSQEQIYSIADHFISLLLKLRHCGAFRALQAPLSTTLRLGYSYSKKTELLQHVLKVCLGTGQITTTRRSAGLPFLVLALAHSCSSRGNELGQLLSHLLPPLISTANSHNEKLSNSNGESTTVMSPSIIHAFNIIRSLVRDSRIASEMGPFMASVAKLCLESFNSEHWNVRNASAMLFSSLISRIFGPKSINDISTLDHHVDLREIDVKFEGLVGILTNFLQIKSADLEPRIAYPLLAVLERIRIPPNERFEELRGVVFSFFLGLLVQLEKRPESGRKLGHVLGRTVFSLISSRSLRVEEIYEQLLIPAPKSTTNGIYNLLILLENVKKFDSNYNFDGLLQLPPLQSNWHPIIISKYNQIVSHKSDVESISVEQKESPVNSSQTILKELSKRLPSIHLICACLETETVSADIIYKILEKFKLNEEIIMIALPLLCRQSSEFIDDRLVSLLSFYSASESNENLRFIVLESLKVLNSNFFRNIPDCIFSLLLDDEEDIRMGICTVLNSIIPSSPAKTLKNFIDLVGPSEFSKFLENYQENHFISKESNAKLFEREPLNLFIDTQYLRKKFCSK